MPADRWEYRTWATGDLVTEEEVLQWRMAMLDQSTAEPECDRLCIESGMAMIADCLIEIREELNQRRTLYHNQYAPKVGKTNRRLPDIFPIARERVTLEMLCQRYGPALRQKGRDSLFGLCPFPDHNERTPSFHVTPSKMAWHCFGCTRSGDVITLAAYYYQDPSNLSVAKRLCEEFGVDVPQEPQVRRDAASRGRLVFPSPGNRQ